MAAQIERWVARVAECCNNSTLLLSPPIETNVPVSMGYVWHEVTACTGETIDIDYVTWALNTGTIPYYPNLVRVLLFWDFPSNHVKTFCFF